MLSLELSPEQKTYAFRLMLGALKKIRQDPKHKRLDSKTLEAIEEALTAAE